MLVVLSYPNPPDSCRWASFTGRISCEPGKQLNVAVLLSGGVDSSLALRLLRAAGHTCRAFYLQIWFQEDFRCVVPLERGAHSIWVNCPA